MTRQMSPVIKRRARITYQAYSETKLSKSKVDSESAENQSKDAKSAYSSSVCGTKDVSKLISKQAYHTKTQHSYSNNLNQDSIEQTKTSNNTSYSKDVKSVGVAKNNQFKVKKPIMPSEMADYKNNKLKVLKCKKKSPNQSSNIHFTKMNSNKYNTAKPKKDPIRLKQK